MPVDVPLGESLFWLFSPHPCIASARVLRTARAVLRCSSEAMRRMRLSSRAREP